MLGYFAFLFLVVVLMVFVEITRKKGFQKLSVYREVESYSVVEGENIKITTVIENNKRLPIFFLVVKEGIPENLEQADENSLLVKENQIYHVSRYNVWGYERVKKTYSLKSLKRGLYLLRDVEITIGDVFGFYSTTKDINDYVEILVYPRLVSLKGLTLDTQSLYGDNIIKRWIHRDPLYIKGIREYSTEDRMKDIHWKSSLKMNKLMVKDYDFTAEEEFMIILNVQCFDPYWSGIDDNVIENGIRISASIAYSAIQKGVPTGICTNAQVLGFTDELKGEVAPSLNSFNRVMEMCARIDYAPRMSIDEYLRGMAKNLNRNCTYILITPFLNSESVAVIGSLRRAGFVIKIIDISKRLVVPSIDGVEKISYRDEI